jgi:hypothetical protein
MLRAVKHPCRIECRLDAENCIGCVGEWFRAHSQDHSFLDALSWLEQGDGTVPLRDQESIAATASKTRQAEPVLRLVSVDATLDPARTVVPFLWARLGAFGRVVVKGDGANLSVEVTSKRAPSRVELHQVSRATMREWLKNRQGEWGEMDALDE